MKKNKTVAIVGAGIVGLSCALWLQKKGFTAILIDPEQPGSGTSSGKPVPSQTTAAFLSTARTFSGACRHYYFLTIVR